MRSGSLATRLLLACSLLLPLFLGLTGLILEQAFKNSQETARAEQLKLQGYLLMGSAEWMQNRLWMPENIPEPRLRSPDSGLYAYISDGRGEILWRSASALAQQFVPPSTLPDPGSPRFMAVSASEPLFAHHELVLWEDAQENTVPLLFSVLESRAPMQAELSSYRATLWSWLGGLGVLLALLLGGLLRWGLSPLRDLAADLEAIEQGRAEQLEGDYPRELRPVTRNLNQLILSERHQRERYRHSLGDLAHSLKTPLAILRGASDHPEQGADLHLRVREQVERMDQIVRYQLQRAVAAQGAGLGQSVDLSVLVPRIQHALEKVYRDKGVRWELELPESLPVAGEEQDLMELLGNLLDNACKYGHRRVRIRAQALPQRLVRLCVEDDGPGVPEPQRQLILQRGHRADSAQSGQGIGLAVVVDILSSYRGELAVEASDLGGACFRIELPGA